MKIADFFTWHSEGSKCRNVFTSNSVHLQPYSSEKYMVVLPTLDYSDLVMLNKEGNEVSFDYELAPDYLNNKAVFISSIIYDDWDMVRLKMYGGDIIYYSNFFRVSEIDFDKTTYLKYRDNRWSYFGAMRVCMEHWHDFTMNEVQSYYQITKEQTITVGSKRSTVSRFLVTNTDINVLNAITDVFTYPIVYVNGYRGYVSEMPEVEKLQANEIFKSMELNIFINKNDRNIENIDLQVYALGNREANQLIGDGENEIINSNINV